MPTRLAIFSDKLLEAGWLAALIVAPLFFNVYSNRVFEPDKISLVRSLALLMIAAWIIKQVEVGLPRTPIAETARTIVRENPLVLPTVAVVIIYLIATGFSVVPSISFWGSYQRLQGTYTTISYVAIFLIAASSLRTRAQLDRAINTALVVSFPIALYGILQHFKLDPLPWGGDVTVRVASNMGNSIFVAAYLIMVVPLAVARWIETLARLVASRGVTWRWIYVGAAALGLTLLIALWIFNFTLGVALVSVLFLLALVFALLTQSSFRDTLLATMYTIILAVQLIAIFFTQSRGPWLGLAGGLFAFAVLYALARGARRVALSAIGLAAVASVFLAIFNSPASPLDPLKRVPYVGRLGQILETESGTGKVRELIWQGAIKLITPHAPLWSPATGDDPFNAIRPWVGYGPEAMYVAFNPFYPADLGHYEQRNASPDRSHNETFDSLVMTGLLGFGAYVLLFISIFYFGLKWLGMITSPVERNAFIALWLAGGFIFSIFFGLWRGWSFIGVALPAGMILGFFIFLVVDALRTPSRTLPRAAGEGRGGNNLWLSALIAALIGHFIEIHFGIAIVSTRLYFWFYTALLVILGMNRLVEPSPAPVPVAPPGRVEAVVPRKRKRRRDPTLTPAHVKENARDEISLAPILVWTGIVTLILLTLAFEFINNQAGTLSALDAVRHSLFFKGDDASPGIFFLFALTGATAGIVGLNIHATKNTLGLATALFVVLSFTALVWFVLFQARWLTQPGDLTDAFLNLLALYYVGVFLLVGALALSLCFDAPYGIPNLSRFHQGAGAVVVPVLAVILAVLVYATNFAGVSADILYKAGGNYDNAGAWDRSIDAYQRALALQPAQDFYALFLGRAYLESARSLSAPVPREQMLRLSEQALLNAQHLNPLNTDHSANLARLHRVWAALGDDPTQKAAHYQKSSEYYRVATRLSPNTAYLHNEWSQMYFQSNDLDKTRAELEASLRIDQQFPQTYLYLGEYYRSQHDTARAAENYFEAIRLDPAALSDADATPMPGPMSVLAQVDMAPRAIDAYRAVIGRSPASIPARNALAELYKRSGNLDRAREELERAIQIAPNDYMTHLSLVNFFSETGQIDAAVGAMRRLMDLISPTRTVDYPRFQDFYAQLQNLQRAIQAAQRSPNDVGAHRTLAALWKARGQAQFALPEYQTVARLAPNDYDAQKNLALLNLQLNHPEDAQRAFVAAAPLAPDNEKSMWQNLQMALNAQKAQQLDQALKQAQAALALAAEGDRPALQAYLTQLQEQVAGSRQ
jgi:tetratricopeptide (TPR) repeat protein